jgi:hypothetical protein
MGHAFTLLAQVASVVDLMQLRGELPGECSDAQVSPELAEWVLAGRAAERRVAGPNSSRTLREEVADDRDPRSAPGASRVNGMLTWQYGPACGA